MVPHPDPEILALRALGESAGTVADDEHIARCQDCRAQLRRLANVVAVARQDATGIALQAPPEQVWQRIAAAVERPDPVAAGDAVSAAGARAAGERRRRRPGKPGWMRGRLAVAGLVFGLGVATGIASVLSGSSAPATQVVGSVSLSPLPQFPQWKGASGTATVYDAASGRSLDVTLRAPRLPGFYEVWLLGRDGVSMISLGELPGSHTGVYTIPPGTNLHFYSRVDVSLQPFDGSTAHSSTSVVRGSLPASATGAASG